MKIKSFRKKLAVPAFRELFLIGVFTVILIAFGLTIHWSEFVINLLYRLQNTALDDVLVSFTVIGVLLTFYTFRRYKEKIDLIRNIQQTKLSLRTTSEQLQALMQSTSAVVVNVKVNEDYDINYISDNAEKVTGFSKEHFFEKNFWATHIHPEDSPKVFEGLNILLKTGFLIIQYRFQHKDGSWRWMNNDMKCLYDTEGNAYEIAGTLWDITKEKQMEEVLQVSNERFELSFKATRNVMYDWNLVTNELWLSDEIYRSYGYDKETVKTDLHWWENKIHPDDHDAILSSVTSALTNNKDSWSGEYRFQLADGNYANIFDRGHISYGANGEPLRWIGSMNDISVLKKTESELKEALAKSEESAKAKSEFVANMSHEIRTPLNGIIGMTDLALDTELTAEQKRYLETVRLSCDSLMTLINDILDFSKIEAGKLDLSPIDFSLRDEIPGFLSPLSLKASFKKLELVFSLENDVPDLLFADVHRLQQIITNLVGNAIKFTERGEVVLKAAVQSATENEAMLIFSVADTGIGIAAHKLSAVFEDFIQADGSTTRKYGGTGLGLSITKRLVEMMGGKIWVESIENKGSTFYFTLRMQLQKQSTKPRFIPLPVLDNTPVLVVEDNDLSRNYTMRVLENFHMKATGVDTCEKAIEALKRAADSGTPYPIVLTDISLAGKMDGFDLAEYIKHNPYLADTDIIVISMSQKVSDRENFAQLGVNQYFSKPFSQSDLLDSIQNALSARNKSIPYTPQIHIDKSMPPGGETANTYRILLAEDNIVNQEVAANMLAKKGHTVVIANNGAEAAAMYRSEPFDLVLMDVQMPLLNGYEATARIRDIETLSGTHTPIIGLTANAMKGDREKCLEAGMDDYVSKPVKMNDLLLAFDRIRQKINKGEQFKKTQMENDSLVSLNTLVDNLEGDDEMLESILGKFDGTVMAQMNAIEINAKKGKASEIISMSHTLKGQCMLVEMERVVKLADKIEILAMKNALTEVNKLIPTLKSELQNGLIALKEARIKLSERQVA